MPVRTVLGVMAVACTGLGLAQLPAGPIETAAVRSSVTLSARAPAQDLPLTSAVRTALVDAAAAHFGLPASDFVGLGAGPYYDAAYYGYDSATSTYWAAASLVPRPSSYQAGVVVQDDGAYLIFNRTAHGAWQAHDVGYSDTVGDCAAYHVSIPAAVVAVWHWVPGTCHPPEATPASASAPKPPAPATGAPGTASDLKVTKALYAQIRASYYDAYRLDPKPFSVFGVQAGLPESHVVGPLTIEDAGVIYGSSASTSSYWVVADICFHIPTGCEDEGAFQVFHRVGQSGDFTYLVHFNVALDVCDIPQPLAARWFPDGRYPMGGHCASAAARATPARARLDGVHPSDRGGLGDLQAEGDLQRRRPVRADLWDHLDELGQAGVNRLWEDLHLQAQWRLLPPQRDRGAAGFRPGALHGRRPLAYQLLDVRVPSAPGGKFGKWFAWDDAKTLCQPYA